MLDILRDLPPPVARNIRVLRESKGMTLKELGDMVGISKSHLSNIEREHIPLHEIRPRILERLAAALETTLEDLESHSQ